MSERTKDDIFGILATSLTTALWILSIHLGYPPVLVTFLILSTILIAAAWTDRIRNPNRFSDDQ